ncbi:hypothetical protein HPB47_019747 [Ixodes persulcatus]|uniref:Uncharacterized protein n=1 Tax=Ixodes persulcatus TaxID=34615 RepID=A0AC60QJV5_IXOPE|nr:hypothetical protein HPB47_019747 [Ixodes persulcatus]
MYPLEDGWHRVSRRRKTALSAVPPAALLRSELSHTVILRPTKPCRIKDAAFLEIDSAIAAQMDLRSPIPLQPPYQVRYHDRSNPLAVDAAASEVLDALLKVTHIPIGI